jgi:hypothetical protein
LDLHNNGLTGPLPQQLGELPNLRFLLLGRNQLTGTVPADFELLTSLGMLLLLLLLFVNVDLYQHLRKILSYY